MDGLMANRQATHSHGKERRVHTWKTGSLIFLMSSSSGIFILKALETGHWSLGNLRKLGLFCHGVFFSTSLAWLYIYFFLSQQTIIFSQLQPICNPILPQGDILLMSQGVPIVAIKGFNIAPYKSLTSTICNKNYYVTMALKFQKHVIMKHFFIQLLKVSVCEAN